ncbi:MAG: endonuclease III [Bacilli bacterium]|nr:endonuclease III [Bacilli bacterium]
MMKINRIEEYLEELYPNAFCELNYSKDYELLIAVVLSAQTTDKRVNEVTKVLFDKYDLDSLKDADIKDIENIIRPIGTFTKKAVYIKEIAKRLINDYNGIVPNDRSYLESLPGVGRKSTNVVLSNLFNVPAIAVDTHVERVSKRLGLAKEDDTVLEVEKKLMKKFKKEDWSKRHHQLVLFGRYNCKAIKPECSNCKLKDICRHKKRID